MGVETCPHDGTTLVPAETSAPMAQTVAEPVAPAVGPSGIKQPAFIDAPTMPDGDALLPPETSPNTLIDPNAVDDAPARAADMVGRIVAGYRVETVLNEGRLGWLLRASTEASGGEPVAIKYIHPRLASLREGLLRYFHEAGAVGKLGHKHIPEVLGRDLNNPQNSYIITELLHGENLRGTMQRAGRLPGRRAVAIALQICEAIRAAQDIGQSHLDLRPEHIFMAARGSRVDMVKVTDFGSFRLQAAARASGMTQFVSPPTFRAPELATQDDGALACDIYSLGVILYQCISGKIPFAEDARAGGGAVVDRIPIPLANVAREVEPALADAVMRCIAQDPAERFGSLDELEKALNGAVGATPSGPAASPFPSSARAAPGQSSAGADSGNVWKDAHVGPGAPPPRSRGRRIITIILTAGLTIGLALAGLFLVEPMLSGGGDGGGEGAAGGAPDDPAAPAADPAPTPAAAQSPDAGAPPAVPDLGAPDQSLPDRAAPAQAPPALPKPRPRKKPRVRPRPRPRPKPRPRPRPRPKPAKTPKPKPKPSGGKIAPNQVKDPFGD